MRRMLSAIIFATFVLGGVASAQEIAPGRQPPVVTRAVAPHFPIPNEPKYAMGSVVVEIQIDARGNVFKSLAVQGHPFLYAASEKAARRWLFASTSTETKVRTARLTFVFKMMEGHVAQEDLSPIFVPPYQIEVRRRVPVIETREISTRNPTKPCS